MSLAFHCLPESDGSGILHQKKGVEGPGLWIRYAWTSPSWCAPSRRSKSSWPQTARLYLKKIIKKLNFLKKFKVKLSVTEHTALCLPYFKAWLQVSDFLSCSQLCLSKWIPGEPGARLPSAHCSTVSWSLCPSCSCSWAVFPVCSPLPRSQILPLNVLGSTPENGQPTSASRSNTWSSPCLKEHKCNCRKKTEKKILFVTKGMKDPTLNLMTSPALTAVQSHSWCEMEMTSNDRLDTLLHVPRHGWCCLADSTFFQAAQLCFCGSPLSSPAQGNECF